MAHDGIERDTIGIFQGDLIIKSAIELSLQDMRKNPWIIEDVFGSLIENPILNRKYGLKEVTRAKEFVLNNEIPVYMRHRLDKKEFPCITLSIGNSEEDKSLATLGDQSVCFEDYDPCDIQKPIRYIISPFKPTSYDKSTGIVEVPKDIQEYRYIDKGMIAIDPKTGIGFIITGKAGDNGFQIKQGSTLPKGEIAIVPQYAMWRARRERAISQESYNIGCHVNGDPSTLIFLYGVVKYALYRYREGLLEHNNFQLSSIRSTDLIKNDAFNIENVYSRWITLSGQVEESWVKSPMRWIEAIDLKDENRAGIQICVEGSNEDPEDTECEPWITIDPNDDEEG